MSADLVAPVDVQIELTSACNWKCRHCYNYWRSNGRSIQPSMCLSDDQLVHIVKELSLNRVPSITITGGEPFLYKQKVFTLLDLAKDNGIHASINTNLSLIEDRDIDQLVSKFKDVSILFSLLSANDKEHESLANAAPGTFAKVISSAQYAVKHGIKISMNMVLMRENLHSLKDTAYLAKQLGVRTFCATKALPSGHTTEETFLLSSDEVLWSLREMMRIEKLFAIPVDILGCYPRCLFCGDGDIYQRFSHRTCVAGCTTVTVGTGGNTRPCSHITTSYGNIFTKPLAEIWKKMHGWREGEFIPIECRKCSLAGGCRGGCRVNTLVPGLVNLDMHARLEHMNVIGSGGDLPTQENICYTDDGTYVVSEQAKFRDESFGALVYIMDPLNMALVNRSAVRFLKTAAIERKTISLSSFLRFSGAKTEKECQSVSGLFRKLIHKGILVDSV